MADTQPDKGNGRTGLVSRLYNAVRYDGWQNVLTGLGTATRDKSESTEFLAGTMLGDGTLEALYRQDDMAARICNLLPREMLRKGFEVRIENDDNPEDVHKIEADIQMAIEELKVVTKTVEAYTWGRLFGGGALFLGANDGSDPEAMSEPLNEQNISTFDSITVLDRRYLQVQDWYGDPSEPKYGDPKIYYISPTTAAHGGGAENLLVHESRIVTFFGTTPTIQIKQELAGWSDSVLQRVNTVLRDFHTGWQGTAHLFTDAAQAVFKIKGLIDQIAAGNTDTIQTRMRLVDLNRSVARAIAIDADTEEFKREPYNFGNVDAVLEKFMVRLAAAADMPVTKLMGQPPSGMDATGESDERMWYDSVAAERKKSVEPQLKRIVELIMLAKDGPTNGVEPESWSLHFPSLWEPTMKEDSEIRKNMAETDVKYIDAGVILPEEVTLSRFSATGYSLETTVDLELREESLELRKVKAIEELEEEPEKDPIPSELPPAEPPPVEPPPVEE